jgi:adenylyltransferase/sulfurtransferase
MQKLDSVNQKLRQLLKQSNSSFQFPVDLWHKSDYTPRVNSLVQVDTHIVSLSSLNAVELLSPYDIILDCTDNPPTRYLLSDVAVLLKKPLISGAAQKYEGQLCIYGLGDQGPCYRCLFPKPPKPESVGSCQETGILGAVTGIIGNLQALEAIKLVTGLHGACRYLPIND